VSEPTVAVVLKGYPRLSETFIAQELYGLQEKGISFDIWSLRHPTDGQEHPVHGRIKARRRYLPEYLRSEPLRVAKGLLSQCLKLSFWRAGGTWVKDFARARDLNRIRRFGQAAVFARELPPETKFLYAHFLHTPASVTRYAAMMRGIPWGFSAHAKDIWTTTDWEKREKIAHCSFGVTCTQYGADTLQALADTPDKVALVYHGLDLASLPKAQSASDKPEGQPFRILSVGRLVEKKGYDFLLTALADLPSEIDWHFTHIGGGELNGAMRAKADELGLSDHIDWRGAQAREAVFGAMRDADLFVLPSRITSSGDRDGLPNVLMEAASEKLPVLSTAVSAIPEFVEDGVSGTLVPPEDAKALGDAIARIAMAPDERRAQAEKLYDRLVTDFGAAAGIDAVATRIQRHMTP